MQRHDFMIDNAKQLEQIIREKINNTWVIDSFGYEAINCSGHPKYNDGPGILCKIKHAKTKSEFLLSFPSEQYPTLAEFIDCLNVDIAFCSIMHDYPELGIHGSTLSSNTLAVSHPHDHKKELELQILDKCYDKSNGNFDSVKFQELTTEAFKANPLAPVKYRGVSTVTTSNPAVLDITKVPAIVASPLFVDIKALQQSPSLAK